MSLHCEIVAFSGHAQLLFGRNPLQYVFKWFQSAAYLGHMDLQKIFKMNKKKTFLSTTTRPIALIFGMEKHLVDFYQVCSNYAPMAKMVHTEVLCFDMDF